MDDSTQERLCGDCIHYFGEECNAKYCGAERYDDSEACDEFQPSN